MVKYQIVVFIGAAILGKVGGEMMLTDVVMARGSCPVEGFHGRADGDLNYLRYLVERCYSPASFYWLVAAAATAPGRLSRVWRDGHIFDNAGRGP